MFAATMGDVYPITTRLKPTDSRHHLLAGDKPRPRLESASNGRPAGTACRCRSRAACEAFSWAASTPAAGSELARRSVRYLAIWSRQVLVKMRLQHGGEESDDFS